MPGYATDGSIAPNQGIFVLSASAGSMMLDGLPYTSGQAVSLQPGWNVVAAPYPSAGLSPSTIATEVSNQGGNVTEIVVMVYGSYQTWLPGIGGSLTQVPATSGMWIEASQASTWTPS